MFDSLFSDLRFIVFFSLFIPVSSAVCSYIINDDRFRNVLNIFFSSILFLLLTGLFLFLFKLLFLKKLIVEAVFWQVIPAVQIKFSIEPLGIVFILLVSFLWLLTNIYSYGYLRANEEKNQKRFSVFFSLSITCVIAAGLSGNLFTLFAFYELLTICTYPLVSHYGDAESKKAGKFYLYTLFITSLLFLAAIAMTLQYADTLDFVLGGVMQGKISATMTGVILFCFVFGVGKAALMPIHRWLPAAMVAPIPVSALLHAVAVVKVGVFIILKVVIYIFGVDFLANIARGNFLAGEWLVYVSGVTIILASIAALKQKNLKRMLAYSTIGQLAYITLSAAIFSPLAVIGGIIQLIAHSFAKITLFFIAGYINTSTGVVDIDGLRGIGRKMPLIMFAFTIAALSIIGIPPTIGFIGKFFIISGAVDMKNYFVLAVLIISTLLTATYYIPIIYNAFFGDSEIRSIKNNINTSYMATAIYISALGVIVLFFYSDGIVNFLSSSMSK